MYTEQIISQNKQPEYVFWSSYLTRKVSDALGCFKIPNKGNKGGHTKYGYAPSLQKQYEEKRQHYIRTGQKIPTRRSLQRVVHGRADDCSRARVFLESSELDEVCEAIGRGSRMAIGVFALVQEGITLEKKLYDEFKLETK